MNLYKTIIDYKKRQIYIWQEKDNKDCFLVDKGDIVCFSTKSEYEAFVNELDLNVIDEENEIYIMTKRNLIELKNKDIFKFCNEMLNVWNLAIDIRNSFTEEDTILDGNKRLYDKLFYGCNLIDSKEEPYVPYFSDIEYRQIKAILNASYKWIDSKL